MAEFSFAAYLDSHTHTTEQSPDVLIGDSNWSNWGYENRPHDKFTLFYRMTVRNLLLYLLQVESFTFYFYSSRFFLSYFYFYLSRFLLIYFYFYSSRNKIYFLQNWFFLYISLIVEKTACPLLHNRRYCRVILR